METPISKLRKTRGISIQKGNRGSVARNVSAYHLHNISIDLLRKQYHSSLDLNQPAQIESPDQYNLFAGHGVNFGVKSESKEIGERSVTDSKTNENGTCSNLNLIVKLSPSKSCALKSTTSWTSLPPPPPQGAYVSSIMDFRLGGTAKDELPSLIVMGCTRCYMYVMASKAHPRCPKCKNRVLIVDKIRGKRAKKLKS